MLTTTVLVVATPPLTHVAKTEPTHIDKQVATRVQPLRVLEVKLPHPQEEMTPITPVTTGEGNPLRDGSHRDWLAAAGIAETAYKAVESIITRESNWNPLSWNASDSGAYGLCQALPASKMETAGVDYMTNPITQLKWCNSYAIARYGSWEAAAQFWESHKWW